MAHPHASKCGSGVQEIKGRGNRRRLADVCPNERQYQRGKKYAASDTRYTCDKSNYGTRYYGKQKGRRGPNVVLIPSA
jgi:hypothetical protein